MKITIHIPPELTQQLATLHTHTASRVVEAAAYGIEAALHRHYRTLQKRPRQDGLAHAGFWHGTPDSVASRITSTTQAENAIVEIDSKPLVHKLTGGTIRAKDYNKTYLTIPANNEAVKAPQGAHSFNTKLMWVQHPDGGIRPALVAATHYATLRRTRDGGTRRAYTTSPKAAKVGAGDILYWLVRQVTHRPQPDALPDDATLHTAALRAARNAINSLLAPLGTPSSSSGQVKAPTNALMN